MTESSRVRVVRWSHDDDAKAKAMLRRKSAEEVAAYLGMPLDRVERLKLQVRTPRQRSNEK